MRTTEMIITMTNCVKQSRLALLKMRQRAATREGRLDTDADAVYEEIMAELGAMAETQLQRQTRLDREWCNNEPKGNRTAQQYQSVFLTLITYMEECGIPQSPKQIFMGYLRRLNPKQRALAVHTNDFYPDPASPSGPIRCSGHQPPGRRYRPS